MKLFEFPGLEEEEEFTEEYPPEEQARPKHRLGKAELIMIIIAVLSAALLLGVIVLCLPYFEAEQTISEDPEDIRQEDRVDLATQPTFFEPTESATEPENPTIPPDRNPYDRFDFQYNRNNYLLLQNLPSMAGVDVSQHQGQIDWEKVADSGIEFAMIRLGYRGYGKKGTLVKDEYANYNLTEAKAEGLKIGAYFFSQALSIREADQEIDFMLDILGSHKLDLPIVLDWEIPTEDARTVGMDARTLTDIQLHFIEVMTEKGYEPMIYFNWHQSSTLYYLSELEEAPFWLALYQDRMTYPWKVEFWQYTDKGTVPGINGPVDLNVYMPD